MFTDEKNSTWENWSLNIQEKLAMNVDVTILVLSDLVF